MGLAPRHRGSQLGHHTRATGPGASDLATSACLLYCPQGAYSTVSIGHELRTVKPGGRLPSRGGCGKLGAVSIKEGNAHDRYSGAV